METLQHKFKNIEVHSLKKTSKTEYFSEGGVLSGCVFREVHNSEFLVQFVIILLCKNFPVILLRKIGLVN